jgi:hypothetical protein
MLWIWIWADPYTDRHPWPDDPDPNPFRPNVKVNYTFSKMFQYTVQNIENYDTYDAGDEDKTMEKGSYCTKEKKILIFYHV